MTQAVVKKEDNKEKQTELTNKAADHPVFHNLQREINKLFDDFKRGFGVTPSSFLEPLSDFHAKIDVKDTETELIVTAELPGVELKNIEIHLNDHSLSIKGEKKEEREEKDKGYYRMERTYGSFHRVLPLTCAVDKDHVTATAKNGVIKISLPKLKAAAASEKKIEVKAG